MYSLPIPFTSTVLELAPRWGEPLTFRAAFPWLLLAVVPLFLILWLYRCELQLVHRGLARFLLSLRVLVIALLLFLVSFQPRLLPAFQGKATERVLVMVDRTGSMEATDPQRLPLEKLRLARALKLAPDLVPDLQLDDWIQQYQKDGAIRWIGAEESADDPEGRKKLEEDRRKQHDRVCARIDTLTRTTIVQRLLSPEGGQLLEKLARRFQVEVVGFAQDVWEPPAGRWQEVFDWPAKDAGKTDDKDREMSLPPSRAYTDLHLPLAHALEQAIQGQGAVRGVVLLTDGRQNRGELPLGLAENLGRLKTPSPLYPVALGTRQARLTLTVAGVEAPAVVLKDPEEAQTINAVVKANIRVHGLPPQPLTVELKGPDKVLGRQQIAHNGVDRDYSVFFPISLDREGPQKLTVEIQPVPAVVDRTGLRRPVEINVIKEQAEVLMVDGEARWEFHYVSVALARDPLVKEVKSVVFEQPRLQKIPEAELEKQNWPAKAMPAAPDALADYDCIIVGDATPEQLPLAERQRLARFVKDTGGTLVLVAGKRGMPMLFPKTDSNNKGETDPLAELLPITEPRVVQSRNGFHVTLTAEGKDNPLLQMDDRKPEDGANSQARSASDGTAHLAGTSVWQQLPPHYWAVVGRKKPAATTLAYYPGEAEETGDKSRSEREGQSLIAWQTFGKGRVLFVGLDSTWRWRFKVGDKHHHRFWGQLIRWATADKLLPGGPPTVRFGTPRPTYEPGQEIEVRVRMAKELDLLLTRPPADQPYQARILRVLPDGREEKVAVVPLGVRQGQPRVLDGRIRDLPVGTYRIELDVPPLADKLRDSADPNAPRVNRSEFSIVAQPSEEMLDLSTDWELLKNLADKSTSGKVYTPEDARKLVDDLIKKEELTIDRTPRPLWEWWPTLVLILLLLTMEWVARKWSGLP